MDHLKSIENIHKVYDTKGSNPILVTCNDMNDYVAKYSRTLPASSLFLELLASKFLKIWNIPTPDIGYVDITQKHLDGKISSTIQPAFFNYGCFGSKHLKYAKDIEDFFLTFENKNEIKKIYNKEDFLRIGLFDLWMCNEDRHQMNYNLLLNPDASGKWYFYAIDHEKCFNSNTLSKGPCILNENETILNSKIFSILYGKSVKIKDIIDEICKSFNDDVIQCNNSLTAILKEVPSSWNIDINANRSLIEGTIFADSWINKTEQSFRKYVQMAKN